MFCHFVKKKMFKVPMYLKKHLAAGLLVGKDPGRLLEAKYAMMYFASKMKFQESTTMFVLFLY